VGVLVMVLVVVLVLMLVIVMLLVLGVGCGGGGDVGSYSNGAADVVVRGNCGSRRVGGGRLADVVRAACAAYVCGGVFWSCGGAGGGAVAVAPV